MKLKIKVKRLNKSIELPTIIDKGEWVDLRAAKEVKLNAPQAATLKRYKINGIEQSHRDVSFDIINIPLGIAVKLPKGFEAIILARSSTPKNFGIITANAMGVVDNTYSGNNDEWKYPVISLKDTSIKEGDRICQFRIQLSQKASIWQKIKWLLSSGIRIIEVENLDKINRGGFGSTNIK